MRFSLEPIDEWFSVRLRLIVGPEDSSGAESFDLPHLFASRAKKKECERAGFVLGRHRLIVHEHNFLPLRQIIEKLVRSCSGKTSQEIAEKVGRIGYWEFEEYESK